MKKWKIILPTLLTTSGLPLVSLVGCSDSKTYDFNTCSWSHVSNLCNKFEQGKLTEQEFCQRFKFGDTQCQSLDDFIGQERTINLNLSDEHVVKHKVKVIGTNHDTIANANSKKAALSFQFFNLCTVDDYNSYLVSYDASKIAWDGSRVQSGLRNHVLKSLEECVPGVKTVLKKSFNKQGTDITTTEEKIFVPSVSEIFDSDKLSKYVSGFTEEFEPNFTDFTNIDKYYLEGETYAYWKRVIKNESHEVNPELHITTLNITPQAYEYWTRTKLYGSSGIDNAIWFSISPDMKRLSGVFDFNMLVNKAVSPIFCI